MKNFENQTVNPEVVTIIHELSVSEVYLKMQTSAQGLTKSEAEERLKRYGRNTIQEAKGKPLIWKFLSNFTHLMAILLWVGGIIGFIAQLPQLGIAIWMVNIINGVFSFLQEFRAEKATEALRKLLPAYALVLRDEKEIRILAEELVPGDIIILSEGDRISADARLVEDNDLRSDQSTLTGESQAVKKTKDPVLRTDLARSEEPNLIFAGTNVAAGAGKAIVFATGMNTEFGKIAGLTQSQKEVLSPLQKELKRVTKTVSFMAISIGTFFFVASVFIARGNVAESFIFAMGMIIAFVPEGLLPTVTLSLAMGVQRMAKRNALIKRLSAVETLGCTTIICTDKTGTLTQNEMTVSNLWLADAQFKVTGVGYGIEGKILNGDQLISQADHQDLRQLLVAASLCNNARLVSPNPDSPRFTILGDPTEAAMLVAARKSGLDLDKIARENPRLRELPFESRRKRMSTIHPSPDSSSNLIQIAYVKGAPQEVLDLCTHILSDGQEHPMNETQRSEIMKANDDYARSGLRVLAVAMRRLADKATLPLSLSAYTPELVEQNMTFLGLIAMADPPRLEVTAAVKKCHHSSIRIIMITGDYGLTAESIARRIGIIKGAHPRILTGNDLAQIDEAALKEALGDEIIFARVAPEQKLRVVTALQEMGHVVAVTGDGVNDAPALKKADIGVAMGISGTDVAKEAADMILTDDNFASIVNAVEEGRAVYNNIRKFAIYIFNSNMSEAAPFILFLFSRGSIPLPLTIMQILAMDLGTDMVPAIGLGAELPESGIMDRPPRSQKEPLLRPKLLLLAFLWYGILESIISISAYFFLNWQYGWPGVPLAGSGTIYMMATTMTLTAIVICQVGVVFNARTERASIFTIGFFSNRLILIGIAVELILICMLIYIPVFHDLFNTAPLGLSQWAFLIIWAPIIVLLDECRKMFLRKWDRHIEKNKHKSE
ncbi:MAG: cation-translocating P-type ATPase [Acetobacterium sp.]